MTSPICGFLISHDIATFCREYIIKKRSDCPYDIVVERSKDQRVCNFQKDVDPLMQEDLSPEKLQSPQMIYLPHYVTNAKFFMMLILRARNKGFSDPYTGKFLFPEEREAITEQILAIFQISQKELDDCFKIREKVGLSCFRMDFRGVDEKGQFTADAEYALKYSFPHVENVKFPLIDECIDQYIAKIRKSILKLTILPRLELNTAKLLKELLSHLNKPLDIPGIGRYHAPFNVGSLVNLVLKDEETVKDQIVKMKINLRRAIRLQILDVTSFLTDLRKDDCVESRIKYFEKVTGVFLKDVLARKE
ncbi:MAG: hypothetical protein P0S93_03450 [Candidatus Neptunochlamydia sp.]|nr:hypothetical protein [Candidatus Neptunochlamydia sp.]